MKYTSYVLRLGVLHLLKLFNPKKKTNYYQKEEVLKTFNTTKRVNMSPGLPRGKSKASSHLFLFSFFSFVVFFVAPPLGPSSGFFCVVEASKTRNRKTLMEKYGIDCGSHCTNAVVKLAEAKIEQEKYAVLKQYLSLSFFFRRRRR